MLPGFVVSAMLRDAKEVGDGLDLQVERRTKLTVEKSDPDAGTQDLRIDEIDLRGLVCSAIHEYRVSETPAELMFVDEHPYAIIQGDRASAVAIVRAFFDFAIQESPARRLTVRLYSIGEELYVEVTGEAEHPADAASISSKEEAPNPKSDTSRRRRLGLSKGWLRFRNSTEHGAMLAMSFRSS
jgi:hypothetical protein